MTPALKNKVLDLLPGCKNLEAADLYLSKIPALKDCTCRAMRWGLFDGWAGRPATLAGLVMNLDDGPDNLTRKDYMEGYEIGRELSLRELPS